MTLSHLMNHPALVHLGLSLAHFLWQGAAIAMLLAVALFATRRRSPELRHGLCLFAMLAMALCPAGTLWYFHANPPTGLTPTSALNPEPEAQARDHNPPEAQARDNNPPEAQARDNSQTEAQARDHSAPARASGFALLDTDSETRPGAMPTRGASELATATEPPAAGGHAANAETVGLVTEPRTQQPDAMPDAGSTPSASDLATATARPAADGPAGRIDASTPRTPRLAWGLTIAAIVWAVGVTLLGIRFVFAWLGLCRLRRGTESLPEAIARIADRLRAAMGLRANVPVRISRAIREPIAFGLLRPIVLVPASLLTGCPAEMLEAVIAHELAHIRRHDLWINLLQRAIETLLFYHPAVWWVSGRLRLERELCCDDLAIRATGRRADYAGALVELSGTLHGWRAPILTAGMFTSRLSLPARVRRILQVPSTTLDPNRGRYWMAGPLTLLLASSLVLTAVIHAGVAQSSPSSLTGPAAPRQPTGAEVPITSELYRIRPGDQLSLRLLDFVELNKETALLLTVDEAGQIYVPGIGILQAAGKTYHQVREDIIQKAKAAGVYERDTEPFIVVEVVARQAAPSASGIPVRPLADGIVTEVLVEAGQSVKKGDLLFRLDDAEAKIELASAMIRLQTARANLEVMKELVKRKAPNMVDHAEVNKAEAAPRLAELDVQKWKLLVERCEIRSPADGMIRFADIMAGSNQQQSPEQLIGKAVTAGETLMYVERQGAISAPVHTRPAGERSGAMEGPMRGMDFSGPSDRMGSAPDLPGGAVQILAPSAGVIEQVRVKPGQQVKKGDVLVKFDTQDLELELKAAEIRLKAAKEQLEIAEQQHKRGLIQSEEVSKLLEKEAISALELERTKLRLDRASIRSPIDGHVFGDESFQFLEGRFVEAGHPLSLFIRPATQTQPAGRGVEAP